MNTIFAVGGVLSAFGVSGAAGLNATLPLLACGLLARTGHLDLSPSYHALTTTPVLVVLAVLFVIDVVGDKVPGVDHVLHVVGAVAYPVAGGIAFASQAGLIGHVPQPVAWVLGMTTAGGLHLTRSSLRPLSTVATGGLGNPVVSAVEDVTSAVLTAVALIIPILAALAVLLLLLSAWRLRRRWRRRRATAAAAGPPA